MGRARLRDLGIGSATLIRDEPCRGAHRVTAIWPRGGEPWNYSVFAASTSFNGNDERSSVR
jgi:hypothetical protein